MISYLIGFITLSRPHTLMEKKHPAAIKPRAPNEPQCGDGNSSMAGYKFKHVCDPLCSSFTYLFMSPVSPPNLHHIDFETKLLVMIKLQPCTTQKFTVTKILVNKWDHYG